MKFLITTSRFLFALLICIPAHSIQANTMAAYRNPGQRKNRDIGAYKRQMQRRNQAPIKEKETINMYWIALAVIGVPVLLGAGYLYTQSGNNGNQNNEENQGGTSLEQENKDSIIKFVKWDESIWDVKKVGKNQDDTKKAHSQYKIMRFMEEHLGSKANDWTSPGNRSSRRIFKSFVSDIYWERKVYGNDTHLSGLDERKAREDFSSLLRVVMNTLMGDCTVFGIDTKKIAQNDSEEKKRRDTIVTEELNKLLEAFQDCHAYGLLKLYQFAARYKALGTDLKGQLRIIIDNIKVDTLRRLIATYNPGAVTNDKEATRWNAPLQLFHLTNAHIKKFGSEIGLDPDTTKGDRNADIKYIRFVDPEKKDTITEEQFKQLFKKEMKEEIAASIAPAIVNGINNSIKSEEKGGIEDIKYEIFNLYFRNRKKAPLTSDREKAYQIFLHKGDLSVDVEDPVKIKYTISKQFAMYLLEDCGFIKDYTSNYMKEVRDKGLEVEVQYGSKAPVKKPYTKVEADLENVASTLCRMT